MKILVADDSRAMRMIVIRTLRQAGFGGHEVIEAENGREALGLVGELVPDLILADWNMPELTGMELLGTLRLRGDATPFCFVTSAGSEEMSDQAVAAGALGLVAKPFTAEVLRDMLSPVVTS
jgi:two-component system, chemotaxis family, chemotaxis protein CheY